ncbi:MAG: hypothetical protein CL926_12275 [Deltaproteobacteria bacterium]|jgi:hypothetical protein|nr:hypothetical protein [Deltaproteobacteria bacterium]
MAQLDSLSKFDVEESIRQEVREWSRQTLESPSKELGGMSACPYAKKTWDAHQVLMTFKRTKSFIDVFESLESYDDKYRIHIIVDLEYEESAEEFHDRVEALNYAISNGVFGDRDLWIMGSHPDDEANEAIESDDFEEFNEISYAMLYIQRLEDLQNAVHKLKNTDYYSFVFGDDEPPHVFQLRESFYNELIER